ncbi:MAG: hypothetical protein AAF561_04415 [Planctomycetota bacterium]
MPTLVGLLSLVFFVPGLTWGLPTGDVNRYLFGDRTPWTGKELVALAGGLDADAAADVDRSEDAGVFLNDTDAERAEIVIRYRLYSEQPDEMLTLRAIASMAERRSPDPQFYTYGGLWTYPVGGLIGGASVLGFVERGGLAFYLDQPSEFAKLYIVMRLYAVFWGIVASAAAAVLVRRITRSNVLGLVGGLVVAALPVVVVAAHEAKPHLPGAALALVAVCVADGYVRRGRCRQLLLAGFFCGAAAGMVPTMLVSLVLLPTAWLIRRSRGLTARGSDLAIASSLAAGVFVATNPFLLLNLPDLASNAGNTASHYQLSVHPATVGSALDLFGVATGRLAGFAGAATLLGGVLLLKGPTGRSLRLLAVPAAVVLVGFAVSSYGRPADHARFAILPAMLCGIAAVVSLRLVVRPLSPDARSLTTTLGAAVLVIATAAFGAKELDGFRRNAAGKDDRVRVVMTLNQLDGGVLRLPADPAPYVVPPFDLWTWQATLESEPDADVDLRRRVDRRLSWADPRLSVVERKPPNAKPSD